MGAAAAIVKVVEHLGDGGGRKEIGLNPGGGALCLVGTFLDVASVLRNNVGSSIGEVAARRIPPRQGVAFIKHTLGWPHPSGCKTGEKPPVKSFIKTQKLQFLVTYLGGFTPVKLKILIIDGCNGRRRLLFDLDFGLALFRGLVSSARARRRLR